VVIKQIIESKWFGLKSDFKDVDVKYEDVMMTMDDWQAIPLIRGLTGLWLARETNAIATCVAALVLKE
jgi:predicted exporter